MRPAGFDSGSGEHKQATREDSPPQSPEVRILELGVGLGIRAERLIRLVAGYRPGVPIRYTGLDPFEGRQRGPGLTLKEVFCRLRACGAKVQLFPGEPTDTLSRLANHLGPHDIVVISAGRGTAALPPAAWYYLPRVIRPRAMVFLEKRLKGGEIQARLVSALEISRRAATAAAARRAA
jgi:hypothetical protein